MFVKLPARPGDFLFVCMVFLLFFCRVHSSTTHLCLIAKRRLEGKILFCPIDSYTMVTIK